MGRVRHVRNTIHVRGRSKCTDDIITVFNTIPTTKPHAGDRDESTRVVLSILERLFDMTEREPNVGSQELYLQSKIVPNVLTIEQLVTSDLPNYSLKKTWIKYQKSDPRGYPPRNFAVPKETQNYTKVSTYNISKRQSRKYGKIHFFHSVSHQYVIFTLKRDNQYVSCGSFSKRSCTLSKCFGFVNVTVTPTPQPTQERTGTMW